MAPEVFYKEDVRDAFGFPCDMWAAGLICYMLLAGENPMDKGSRKKTMAAI